MEIDAAAGGVAPQATFNDMTPVTAPVLRGTVMLIDDSPAVRQVIQASLSRVGIRISTFADGFSAMQALVRGEVDIPDILLLDIGMPRMDGYEVARILRLNESFHKTKLVMLTAKDGLLDRVRSRMIGAHDYITKPFRVPVVVERVKGYLAELYPPNTLTPGA